MAFDVGVVYRVSDEVLPSPNCSCVFVPQQSGKSGRSGAGGSGSAVAGRPAGVP